jgi:hypothetical protein
MSTVWKTVTDLAAEVRRSLAGGDESHARRLVFRFLESWDKAPTQLRPGMIEQEPPSTGDRRFDAFIAALVEYVTAREFESAPAWVDGPNRFLDRWWFMSGIRSLEANAIVHSPVSFKRHGVFITEGSLTYAECPNSTVAECPNSTVMESWTRCADSMRSSGTKGCAARYSSWVGRRWRWHTTNSAQPEMSPRCSLRSGGRSTTATTSAWPWPHRSSFSP